MAGDVFISYRRTDLAHARRLHDLLKAQGVDAWYDVQVGAGQDWRAATAAALSRSRIFVLLFSKAAAASEDIAKELAAATLSKKLIVPVRIEDVQPEGAFLYELASRNWIDAFEDTDARLGELAASLASVVRGGAGADGIVEFERRPPARKPGLPRRAILLGVGLVALLAILASAFTLLGGPGPVGGRIAFFGIDAAGDDEGAASVAAQASNTILTTFSTLELDVAARAETADTRPHDRLARAIALRAVYAISGTVVRNGGDLSLTLLVEDAPSRTALWADTLEARGATASALAARAAALLNDKLGCVIKVRPSLRGGDIRAIARLPEACESVRSLQASHVERWRALAELAPDSAWVHGNAAFAILNMIPDAAPSSADDLTALAETFLKRGEELDARSPDVLRAKVAAVRLHGGSLADVEQAFVDGLKAAPRGAHLLGGYAAFLLSLGRMEDSARYAREAIALDPLSAPKLLGVGGTLAHAGFSDEARGIYARLHQQFPGTTEWQALVVDALFKGVGSPEGLLASPPDDAAAETRACLGDIAGLARRSPPAAAAGARRAKACIASGALDATSGNEIRAFLGDYDGVFTDREWDPGSFFVERVNPYRHFMFDPELAELRRDRRFAPAAEQAGLVAYWRDTGRAPDFCRTENAPVCGLIAAK